MTDIKITHEASDSDQGDEFLFKLMLEGIISEGNYASLFPRGDSFLVNDSHLALVGFLADECEVEFFVNED